jgi:hypothetical protein
VAATTTRTRATRTGTTEQLTAQAALVRGERTQKKRSRNQCRACNGHYLGKIVLGHCVKCTNKTIPAQHSHSLNTQPCLR